MDRGLRRYPELSGATRHRTSPANPGCVESCASSSPDPSPRSCYAQSGLGGETIEVSKEPTVSEDSVDTSRSSRDWCNSPAYQASTIQDPRIRCATSFRSQPFSRRRESNPRNPTCTQDTSTAPDDGSLTVHATYTTQRPGHGRRGQGTNRLSVLSSAGLGVLSQARRLPGPPLKLMRR